MRRYHLSAMMDIAALGFWPFIRRKKNLIAWINVILFVFISTNITPINGEPNKSYQMQTLCKTHFLQSIYRKLDGAVLWSQNERNLDCSLTFQTHSILQRFVVRFDALQLDCNDHLYIFDGAHANGVPKVDISCRHTKQSIGNIITTSNFLTLKYVTDAWGTDSNGFKLVVTSTKNLNHACKEFRCKAAEFCISSDLTCDTFNHCGDGSDESPALCPNLETKTLFGLEMTWLVLLAVSALLLTCGCFVGIICCCRSRASVPENNLPSNQQHFGTDRNANDDNPSVDDELNFRHLPNLTGYFGVDVIPTTHKNEWFV